jgi:ribosomal protein S15P/S13E
MVKSKKIMNKPVWLKYTESEVKEIILKIAEKNPEMTSEKIGLILRDTYGIPKTKIFGFKIGDVLKEKNLYQDPDLKNISEKVVKLEKHLAKNKGDKKTGKSLIKTKARHKLIKEYLGTN